MKIIEAHELGRFSQHNALFFTKEGLIVDSQASPFIPVAKALGKLVLAIHAVYLDNGTLIIHTNSSPSDFVSQKEFHIMPLRAVLTEATPVIQQQILRATHWVNWDSTYQHCSKCGNKLKKHPDLTEKKCIVCDFAFYPNLAPAIMVLIQRKHEILLARSPHFRPEIYSVIAGFVDIGETAEEAAHRETKEETNIEITQLEYFGTQSWPFSNSFMIAFKAQYLGGELQIDKNELEDARWFDIKDLPLIPSYPSISRKLIDSVL